MNPEAPKFISHQNSLISTEAESRFSVEQVLVAGNRGPCGGVNMSLQATREVLQIVNGREPVYTNWDPVNNTPVVRELEEQGLVNVKNNWSQVPDGSIVLFSAHGVPPAFFDIAKQRKYHVIDTTCELVEKVQRRAIKAEEAGKHIVYVGTKGHPETIGVLGQVTQGNVTLVETIEEVDALELPEDKQSIALTQTTLSVREVKDKMIRLRERFPDIEIPPKKDICYAASNRQEAAEAMMRQVQFLLVVGSQHSHNSKMLREIGEFYEKPSVLLDTPDQIKSDWFTDDIKRVGITSGASVEDKFLEPVIDWFSAQGAKVMPLDQVVPERELVFRLPQESIDQLRLRYQDA